MIPFLAHTQKNNIYTHNQIGLRGCVCVCGCVCINTHTVFVHVCITLYIELRIYIYIFMCIKLCTLVILTVGKGTNMKDFIVWGFFFLHFGFVLTACNVYALLFSLRAEREEFVSKTKVKNWRLSMLPGFGRDTIVSSLQPGHFLAL